MRTYRELPAGHPAIGRPCANCGLPFREGDRTQLRAKRITFQPRETEGLQDATSMTTEAELIHEDCDAA